ncbi:MAG: hypothetical protein M1824_001877 [Vezdaea acicularis]|nr:MAG: hypothetical protein M1824_001877 [Vezdaea acicularis]
MPNKRATMSALKSSKAGGVVEWIKYLSDRGRFDEEEEGLGLTEEGAWKLQIASPKLSKIPRWSMEAMLCSTKLPAVKAKVVGTGNVIVWEKSFDFVPTLKQVVESILQDYDEELEE